MSGKRIVIVNHVAELGGAERVLMDMLAHLDKEKFQVEMIFLSEGRLVEAAKGFGCNVHVVNSGRIRSPRDYWKSISFIRRVIRQSGAQMVVSWAPKPHFYGGVAAMLEGKPSIWWQHGVPTGTLFDKVVSRIPAEAILCPSQSVRDAQASLSPKKYVDVNYPGINKETFFYSSELRGAIRREYNIPEEAFVFAFIGRLQRWKRTDVVIEAFRTALAGRDARLLIVGGAQFGVEKDYEAELKEQVARSGLEEQVIFAGHQHQVERFISACDAVVHSSLFEPFGMVVVEAMAAGRPVLAVGKGGPAEIIRHGVDGYLYDGSAEELARFMSEVYGDRNLTRRVGDEAKKTIDSRFTARIMADRFAHVMEERMANG